MNTKVRRFAMQLQYSTIALALISVCPSGALARDGHSHTPQQHEMTPEQQKKAGALLKIVREATERFKDVSVAEAEGYALQFGCVSGPPLCERGLGEPRRTGRQVSTNRNLRTDAKRRAAADRRRFSASRRGVGQEEPGSTGTHGTAISLLGISQSLRSAGILHAACLGVEG
jgi:hypothetical protein